MICLFVDLSNAMQEIQQQFSLYALLFFLIGTWKFKIQGLMLVFEAW
jgi:hypothetical protein